MVMILSPLYLSLSLPHYPLPILLSPTLSQYLSVYLSFSLTLLFLFSNGNRVVAIVANRGNLLDARRAYLLANERRT